MKLIPIIACAFISVLSSVVQAESDAAAARRFARVAVRGSVIARASSNTKFKGGWHGKLVRVKYDCTGFNSSFLFRHIIRLSGNRASIATSTDGTLYGTTRDKGRRVEATRSYNRGSIKVTVAAIYQNLNSNATVARLGYGIVLSANGRRCSAGYGANAIRAFW